MDDATFADDVRKRMSVLYGMSTPRPVNYPVTSELGRINPALWPSGFHHGTDLGCPKGTAVKNCFDGVVHLSKDEPENLLGKRVWILSRLDTPEGLKIFRCGYCHLNQINFTWSQSVRAGEIVGLSGNSGRPLNGGAYPEHLHFQMEFWPSRELIRPEFFPA
jgi:murein DD-endopeptidase MepM/ murein hydrolase activator NlpD